MLDVTILDNSVIFDIETVPIAPSYEDLRTDNPAVFEAFEYCCKFTNKDASISCEDYFQKQASFNPEYAKVCCFSFGKLHLDDNGKDYEIETRSYYGPDEIKILKQVAKLLEKANKMNFHIGGHNVKNFDNPFLIKRYIINGMPVPEILWVGNKKPWELKVLDSKELWKSGSWTQNTSMVEIALTLGLQSPKNIMDGGDVRKEYWENEAYEKIAKYCEGDVKATMEILLRLTDWFYGKR